MTEETQETQEAGLSVKDLANIKQIIDTAASRGAFKTEEFAIIGGIVTKLTAFIAASQAQADDANEDTTTEETA